jgi:uncharacterized protein (DUF488 family)
MPTIWTGGHSTRDLDVFVDVLRAHEIEMIADVRRFPGSRRLPQFNAAELESGLLSNAIAYQWLPSLGGRRTPAPSSPNDGWTNAAFRGYADHVATEEFADGLFELLNLAEGLNTAIMCAELLWWRCHRRIIADVLVSLGYEVRHVVDTKTAEPHKLAAPARLIDGELSYSSNDQLSLV